jgi:hypothetical protein
VRAVIALAFWPAGNAPAKLHGGTIGRAARWSPIQNERGRQTWAALLLGMKRRLLNLHLLYQFPNPIKHSLIGYSGRNTPILLDLAVEFDAPFTHCIRPF